MRNLWIGALTALLLGAVLAGCAPAARPTPAAPAPPPATAPVAPAAPAVSPEEAAWARVVEAAKKEGRVTIYSFSFIGDLAVGISKAFKEKYGINVELVMARGTQGPERVQTEQRAGHFIADVLEGSAANIFLLKTFGSSQGFGQLPVLNEKNVWLYDPGMEDPEKHLLLTAPAEVPPWYNSKLVKPGEEPKSFRDLLHPRWQGKLVGVDPEGATALYVQYVLMKKAKALDDNYWRELGKQGIKWVPGIRDAGNELAKGTALVAIFGSGSTWAPLLEAGATLRPTNPEEGTPVIFRGGIMVKNAPHPNAARLFMNWLLTQEGQEMFARLGVKVSVRKDVPNMLPKEVQLQPKKSHVTTIQDEMDIAEAYRQGILTKLMKQK